MDLAILGTGLMPFGRHDGVTPIEMGVTAAHAALEDAGLAGEVKFVGFDATDKLVEAMALFKRALAIKEAALGPEHTDVAVILHNI